MQKAPEKPKKTPKTKFEDPMCNGAVARREIVIAPNIGSTNLVFLVFLVFPKVFAHYSAAWFDYIEKIGFPISFGMFFLRRGGYLKGTLLFSCQEKAGARTIF